MVKRKRSCRVLDTKSKISRTASPATATTSQDVARQPSALACFPHEILVNIFTFLLRQDDPIPLFSSSSRRWRNELAKLRLEWTTRHVLLMRSHETYNGEKIRQSPLLDILLVSRSFYYAGVEAYYENNTFRFENAVSLAKFLQSTDIDRRKCIRSLVLDMKWNNIRDTSVTAGRKVPQGYRFTCDTDEPALQEDVLERLPRLKRMVIDVGTTFMYPATLDDIRQRVCVAWPSMNRFEIEITETTMVCTAK